MQHPRYTHLYVLEEGNVWSEYSGKFLSRRIDAHGYYVVSAWVEGKNKLLKVHRLLCEVYISNPENKDCVNHKDGNKLNNELSNLEWVTQNENKEHAKKHGLMENKLSRAQVDWIKENFIKKDRVFGLRALARKFNVSHSAIRYHIKES